jgi:hypothetical protein
MSAESASSAKSPESVAATAARQPMMQTVERVVVGVHIA